MKRGFLLICLVALAATFGISATYTDVRIDASYGAGYVSDVDTADTGADGMAYYIDTMFSDTIDVDSTYRYVNLLLKYVSVDTGLTLDSDTTMDTFQVSMITYSREGGSHWTVYVDTFDNVGDSAMHHFFVDTLVFDRIYFQTIYWDSLNLSKDDINQYNFLIDCWAGGTR
jgi:hypothetical protein